MFTIFKVALLGKSLYAIHRFKPSQSKPATFLEKVKELKIFPEGSTLKTVAELSVTHKFVPSHVIPSACEPGAGKLCTTVMCIEGFGVRLTSIGVDVGTGVVDMSSCIIDVGVAVLVRGKKVRVAVGVLVGEAISVCIISVEFVVVNAFICVTAISVAVEVVSANVDVKIAGVSVIVIILGLGGFLKKTAMTTIIMTIINIKSATTT